MDLAKTQEHPAKPSSMEDPSEAAKAPEIPCRPQGMEGSYHMPLYPSMMNNSNMIHMGSQGGLVGPQGSQSLMQMNPYHQMYLNWQQQYQQQQQLFPAASSSAPIHPSGN